jgi:ribonucleoside-diphosphate reductase beta chain
MLNWDDPLATAKANPQHAARRMQPAGIDDARLDDDDFDLPDAASGAPQRRPHDTAAHVRPGQGVVANAVLMSTAGAAPVVDPNPLPRQALLLDEDIPGMPAAGRTETTARPRRSWLRPAGRGRQYRSGDTGARRRARAR